MRFSQLRLYLFIIIGLAAPLAFAEEIKEPDSDDHSLSIGGTLIIPDAFAGDYLLIGKHPDNGTPYNGSARLKTMENNIVMKLRIGDETTSAVGQFEIPHPPGEGAVLRFVEANNKWSSTCLWQPDLDNYFRLSCYKLEAGVSHSEPGLESFFPIGAWPETVASKYSVPGK
ncbi:hypothetical protein [Cohaesibacter gelatinilyticus]|uniref:Uncharacterized protein n=1 Tax=Cohaesibacter gelatinilyticus TaxID=372072 RepID=A0A285N7K4_9HYPH|nr:hypothetical protein [Cohaesibacter gelatinilyticus]SNZ05399.1 hypothetical protein SAMN06265368_0109 [Cohaesibacter gelatinilyticus]